MHRLMLASLILLPIAALAAPSRQTNLLVNPGFETIKGVPGAGWEQYQTKGAKFATGTVHGGASSLGYEATTADQANGVVQTVTFDPPVQHPFLVSGWSKAQNAAGEDYCLFLDCYYADGTMLWGQRQAFAQGTHDWQRVQFRFEPTKPIAKIRYFVLFRRCTGKVWFDDVSLSLVPFELQTERLTPSLYGGNSLEYMASLSLPASWTLLVADGTRVVRHLSGHGTSLAFSWDGADQSGRLLPGGRYTVQFSARDDLLAENLLSERVITTASGPNRAYLAWTDSALNRLLINRVPGAERSLGAQISLARNEAESFQVALRTAPASTLTDCTVQLSDLQGPGGSRLSRANLTWEQVGWVNMPKLRRSANLPDDALDGWWPEPLLPVSRFSVPPATTQSLWFTVYAPPGTAAGLYKGSVTITPANAEPLTVPIEATVYNFELPTQGHLKTAFALMDGFLEKLYGKPLSPLMRRKYGDFCLQFRLNPDDISRTDPPNLDDLEHYNTRGMNLFNVLNMVEPRGNRPWVCWSPLEVYTPTFKQSLIQRLDPYVAELKRRGLYDKAYCYTFDERGEEFYPTMKEYFGMVKQRWGLPTCTTARLKLDPQTMRDLNVDWNCPLTPSYHVAEADKCRQAGLQVWSYVCVGPGKPYANVLAEDQLLEPRLIWWQCYREKIDGFLYWGLNIWQRQRNDYLIDPEKDGPRLRWSITTGSGDDPLSALNGDGDLLYAGKDGPIASLRLAAIRDGLDDYEYLYLLATLEGSVDKARAACTPVTSSLISYTTDPQVLLKQRETIARRIEKLQGR